MFDVETTGLDTFFDEIIEIGAIMLDSELNIVDTFHSFVKPKYFKKLFSVVKKKTNIQQEDINGAELFREVVNSFKQWIGNEYILVSWGHDDIHHLTENCRYNKINTDWLYRNIDMQKQFSEVHNLPPGQRLSLENALKFSGIQIEETLHRALIDAEYTAKIFSVIFKELDLEIFTPVKVKRKRRYKPKTIKATEVSDNNKL
ncbi:MAG: exonuclease domain-containing protein [Clostridiaceae bacterium]|nr:exonuclease domain-containing protein [Clostridiaceae bacterium]